MHPARRNPPLELYKSSAQFQKLLDKLPAAAYMCDAEGLITYYNQHAVDVWGRTPKLNDPVDRYCGSFKLFTPEGEPVPHEECWMALALRNDREYNGHEIVIETASGERLTVLAHANPIRNENGVLIGAVNVLVDITERKRAEKALASADRAKTEFLATLSHELRNPLAPIRNSLHILRRKGSEEPEGRKALDVIERQMQQMTRLVDDLLDISRISRNKLKLRLDELTLAAVLEASIEISRPIIDDAGHALRVSAPDEDVWVRGDIHRLAQAVSNLLNNAAAYTAPGGNIELEARRSGQDVHIIVRDDGAGIPEEMLSRIFETFAQTDGTSDSGGLGIGLPLAKRVVELHGGSIDATSKGAGQGSTFTIRLPVAEAPASDTAASRADKETASAPPTQRILVVDDNEDIVESTTLLLELMNVNVRSARDGREALSIAEDFGPDVILLDIGMPEMDGLETARALRKRPWGRNARLIAVTGWGQQEDIRRSMEAGFDDHIVKPMDPDALMDLLRSTAGSA